MATKKRPRPRTGSRTSPARIKATQRAAEALRLRAAGMSLKDIAARLGYRGKQGAYDAIQRGLTATLQGPADALRRLDLERLDRLWRGCFLTACSGDYRATLACVAIMERRARLLGLDAPRRTESRQLHVAGTTGVIVVHGLLADNNCQPRGRQGPHEQ